MKHIKMLLAALSVTLLSVLSLSAATAAEISKVAERLREGMPDGKGTQLLGLYSDGQLRQVVKDVDFDTYAPVDIQALPDKKKSIHVAINGVYYFINDKTADAKEAFEQAAEYSKSFKWDYSQAAMSPALYTEDNEY